MPQTWEDPNVVHPATNARGDNDPLDIVEISGEPIATGTAACPLTLLHITLLTASLALQFVQVCISTLMRFPFRDVCSGSLRLHLTAYARIRYCGRCENIGYLCVD